MVSSVIVWQGRIVAIVSIVNTSYKFIFSIVICITR